MMIAPARIYQFFGFIIMDPVCRYLGWLAPLLVGVLVAAPVAAQVSVAPTTLFLSEQERFGGLYISNESTSSQEVTIGFRFGYPTADSVGDVSIQYDDSVRSARFSIAPYVRAFPQRFILPPGETQVVRLTATPPGDVEEGMYWTRVTTTSVPQVEFQADTLTSTIETRVQFRLQQVTALFYRKGDLDVRAGLGDLTAAFDSSTVHVDTWIDHAGNGPFFGAAAIRILDATGRVLREEERALAVYLPENRRFRVPLPDAGPGTYRVELTLTSARSDLPRNQLIEMEPLSRETTFTIPAGS